VGHDLWLRICDTDAKLIQLTLSREFLHDDILRVRACHRRQTIVLRSDTFWGFSRADVKGAVCDWRRWRTASLPAPREIILKGLSSDLPVLVVAIVKCFIFDFWGDLPAHT